MSKLIRLAVATLLFTSIPSCKTGATWQIHETSPAQFANQPADHYFASVAVSWFDGTFDTVNTKEIRIYIADDRLSSQGNRNGELFEETWEIVGGSVETEFTWDGDLLTIDITRVSDGHVLLEKIIKIDGAKATVIEDKKRQNKSEEPTPNPPSD